MEAKDTIIKLKAVPKQIFEGKPDTIDTKMAYIAGWKDGIEAQSENGTSGMATGATKPEPVDGLREKIETFIDLFFKKENCGYSAYEMNVCLNQIEEAIKEAGICYREVEGKPPVITRLQIRKDTHYIFSDKVWEMILDLLIDQRDADMKFYTERVKE